MNNKGWYSRRTVIATRSSVDAIVTHKPSRFRDSQPDDDVADDGGSPTAPLLPDDAPDVTPFMMPPRKRALAASAAPSPSKRVRSLDCDADGTAHSAPARRMSTLLGPGSSSDGADSCCDHDSGPNSNNPTAVDRLDDGTIAPGTCHNEEPLYGRHRYDAVPCRGANSMDHSNLDSVAEQPEPDSDCPQSDGGIGNNYDSDDSSGSQSDQYEPTLDEWRQSPGVAIAIGLQAEARRLERLCRVNEAVWRQTRSALEGVRYAIKRLERVTAPRA